jgi:hypothetical protein
MGWGGSGVSLDKTAFFPQKVCERGFAQYALIMSHQIQGMVSVTGEWLVWGIAGMIPTGEHRNPKAKLAAASVLC